MSGFRSHQHGAGRARIPHDVIDDLAQLLRTFKAPALTLCIGVKEPETFSCPHKKAHALLWISLVLGSFSAG
jgi:hypothetical protein